MGEQGRLRAILDNASLHRKDDKGTPPEVKAAELIKAAARSKVKQGHFGRYQHNKVFIKRDAQGNAQKVLFGSMNFSVRGLYVQANNVMVVDDPRTAGYFADAFDNAFDNATPTNVSQSKFAKSKIAAKYNEISATDTASLPKAAVALSPHQSSTVSLGLVADRIRHARSSVLFAVMEPNGQGPVLTSLRAIAAEPIIFSYGTVETDSGLAVQNADGAMGKLASFAYLKDKVPAPFSAEWSGKGEGEKGGKSIHHKFVVIDFNLENAVVFTGSSNLAAGGEEQNGDSLIVIEDPVIAGLFAIEALRLFDHYSFRKAVGRATKARPLSLWFPGKPDFPHPWWKSYYDKSHIHYRDRLLFADLHLPPDLQSVKNVDWASLDKLAEEQAKAEAKKRKAQAAAGTKPAKRKSAAATAKRSKKTPKKTAAAKRKPNSRRR